jgi:PEP-CTERM motif-containing protein
MQMRKLVLALTGAAALTFGTAPAKAVVVFDDIDSLLLALAGTEFFGATIVAEPGAFNHQFDFILSADFLANAQVSEISLAGNDIDFSSILLDTHAFTQTGFDPLTETWELIPPALLTAGLHSIFVNGSVVGTSGNGSYVGNLNIAAPIPEPATWAMMLLGFGAVGFTFRKVRRATAIPQIA